MGRDLESFVENVGSLDISHQEIDRILKTVEEMYSETKANAPEMEWMPVQAVGNLICFELGYEDMDEFEDAMKGSFHDFISHFPIIEIQQDDRVAGGHTFRVRPDPPRDEWSPTMHRLRVRSGDDLTKRVCHKSKWGRICVPCIEFEIQADGQRHIDTLYSHIGGAVTNLAAHCSSMQDSDTKIKILETVEELTKLLDVPEPWEIQLIDPSGVSEITPSAEVAIERYDPDAPENEAVQQSGHADSSVPADARDVAA